MRRITLLALGLLCLLPPALRAEEGDTGDQLTAQVPKNAPLYIRLRSFDRADAIAKEARPLLALLGAKEEAAALDQMPVSAILAGQMGLDLAAIDRTKPIYAVMTAPRQDALVLAHPAAGAAWEGRKAGQHGLLMELREGAFVAGEEDQLALETRGVPSPCLDGDITFHVYLGELAERNRDMIEGAFARVAMMGAAIPGVPENVRALVLPVTSAIKEGVFSVESFDYAITCKGDTFDVEGLLTTKPRSPLREALKRAGAPGTNPMIAYLPADAFVTYDFVGTPGWPGTEIAAMLDKALGEGAASGLGVLFNPLGPLSDSLTGRVAGSTSFLGMSPSSISIAELKPGTDAKTLFEKYEVDSVNAALAKAGLPLKFKLDKAFAKHGETELHRMTMQSENMQLAMMASMVQTFLAAENGHLYAVASPTAEADLCALLDRVRSGEKPAGNPHARAMARLGPHNLGITYNAGALKPLAWMLAMAAPPEVGQALSQMPDEMLFSTAVTFSSGDVHWRGDWPVKQIVEFAAKLQPKAAEESKPQKQEEEEDFK